MQAKCNASAVHLKRENIYIQQKSSNKKTEILSILMEEVKGLFPFSTILVLFWTNFGQFTPLDKALFSTKKYLYFSYFSTKTYDVGTH